MAWLRKISRRSVSGVITPAGYYDSGLKVHAPITDDNIPPYAPTRIDFLPKNILNVSASSEVRGAGFSSGFSSGFQQ